MRKEYSGTQITDSIIGFILGLIVLFFMVFSFTGCETVVSKNRAVFEDGEPVIEAKVREWNNETSYEVYTNENGEWELLLPTGSTWSLCIENERNDHIEACYNGTLYLDANGTLI